MVKNTGQSTRACPGEPRLTPQPPIQHVFCSSCGEQIDPETCWCGDLMDNHHQSCDHSPVELGCICFYKDFNMDQ